MTTMFGHFKVRELEILRRIGRESIHETVDTIPFLNQWERVFKGSRAISHHAYQLF